MTSSPIYDIITSVLMTSNDLGLIWCDLTYPSLWSCQFLSKRGYFWAPRDQLPAVSWLVGPSSVFMRSRVKDSLEFLVGFFCRTAHCYKGKEYTREFFKKESGSFRNYKKLELFSKLTLTILQTWEVRVFLSIFQPAKMVCQTRFWFFIFIERQNWIFK